MKPSPNAEGDSSAVSSRAPETCGGDAGIRWTGCPRVCAAAEPAAANDRAATAAVTMTVLNFICPLLKRGPSGLLGGGDG